MKRVLLYYILTCISTASYAQCNLDLGSDIYACSTPAGIDSSHIGTGVSIQNMTPPISYTWYAHHIVQIGSFINYLNASDLLDDTTSANPRLISDVDSVKFFLTATDANGLTCTDSISVYYSYIGTHLGYLALNMMAGDSIYLNFTPNLFEGIPPLQYLWRPNHGLIDSTLARGFWAKPDSSINYYLTVTDSVGCSAVAPPLYFITVHHIGLDEIGTAIEFSAFPNPTSGIVTIQFEKLIHEAIEINISDASGRTIKRMEGLTLNEQLEIKFSMHDLNSGIYYLSISTDSHKIGVLKVSKN